MHALFHFAYTDSCWRYDDSTSSVYKNAGSQTLDAIQTQGAAYCGTPEHVFDFGRRHGEGNGMVQCCSMLWEIDSGGNQTLFSPASHFACWCKVDDYSEDYSDYYSDECATVAKWC